MLLDLLQPRFYALEGLAIGNVEYYYDTISPFVVSIRDCSVSLLSGRVPNLQLGSCFVDLQGTEALQ